MANRNPDAQTRSQYGSYWGVYATAGDLPNSSGALVQSPKLEVGDDAYVTKDQIRYVCIDATLGAAQWSGMGLVNANFDAFGRLRVSNPQTVFDSKLVYDDQPQFWANDGPGTMGYLQSDARVRLGVVAGQTETRQTKRWFSYEPGKSQQIVMTFCMRGASAGVSKRVGQFSDTDGIFFEVDAAGALNFVRRSGSSVPTQTVPQALWNIDKLDGTGPSGITLDVNDTQMLIFDYQWLGVGSIRIGFDIGGKLIYCHQFDSANIANAVYMSTPNLPCRYQLVSAGGAGDIDCISTSVISEGGQSSGTVYSAVRSTLTANVAANATVGVFHIRPYGANPRVTIKPAGLSLLNTASQNMQWQLVINPSFAAPVPVWPGTTRDYVEISETLTGGYVANSGIVIASGLSASLARAFDQVLANDDPAGLYLGTDVAGSRDFLSIIVTNLGAANDTYRASIDWRFIP